MEDIKVFTDSQLVADQVNKEFKARGELIIKYLTEVRCRINPFHHFSIMKVPWSDNSQADTLTRLASEHGSDEYPPWMARILRPPSVHSKWPQLRSHIRRPEAHLWALVYKKVIARLYDHKVRPLQIRTCDLVLSKAEVNDLTRSRGPYRVINTI
ncbi:hypothetical protein BHE74_00036298 [Ensete ventricosum]|uniref:Uncharacterized protein n=1 Tax=Ensete ventricosum TaxID=4639 RepID=A0A445MC49_ENSVE|nr:hypothetical protein BHE74_00036298 [Ensete ventricosum]RZR71831.1 hypothetical protein BHM03_00007735 [Ensete ventricosum]